MKHIWQVWIVTLLVLNFSARAQEIHYDDPNDPYYQITEVTSETVGVQTEPLTAEKLAMARADFKSQNSTEMREISHSMTPFVISPYLIAQVLFKLWDIVLQNKPVVNVDVKSVSALPIMADYHWAKLTGWQPERVVRKKVQIKNLYGQSPIEMDYAVKLLYGGGVGGRGQYIASARVLPINVKVLWGYNLDVSVNVPSVTNVSGRDDDPTAQITLVVTYKIKNWLKKTESTDTYKLQGDGYFQQYNTGKEYFEPVYHEPAPPLPSPSPTPNQPAGTDPSGVLPTDPSSVLPTNPSGALPTDPLIGGPTPTPTPARKPTVTKPANAASSPKPEIAKPGTPLKKPTPTPTPKKP